MPFATDRFMRARKAVEQGLSLAERVKGLLGIGDPDARLRWHLWRATRLRIRAAVARGKRAAVLRARALEHERLARQLLEIGR